jgi:hypothetical protein
LTGRSTGDCNRTKVTENGAKAGVRRGRRGGEAGTGGVEVSGVGAGQIKAEELGSPLSRGVGVVGGTIPLAGAAKGFVGGRQETKESRGASGTGVRLRSTSYCIYNVQYQVPSMVLYVCTRRGRRGFMVNRVTI